MEWFTLSFGMKDNNPKRRILKNMLNKVQWRKETDSILKTQFWFRQTTHYYNLGGFLELSNQGR
jgi:hypothetical protein